MIALTFLKNIFDDISLLCGVTDTPVFGLLMTSVLGFKDRFELIARVLCRLRATESSGATHANFFAASMVA